MSIAPMIRKEVYSPKPLWDLRSIVAPMAQKDPPDITITQNERQSPSATGKTTKSFKLCSSLMET
jgi:hypothetical protein